MASSSSDLINKLCNNDNDSYLPIDQITINTEAFLGSGSYGSVYLITLNGKNAVVKKAKLLNSMHMDIFKNEKYVLQKLRGPWIVEMLHWSISKESIFSHGYIIMEYMEEGDLEKYIKTKPCPEILIRGKMAKAMIGAVNYMHKNHFVHGDIKSSNFLIRKETDGENFILKLADFGAAWALDKINKNKTYTPFYTPPEEFEKNPAQYISLASNVYSASIVLWETITWKQLNDFGCYSYEAYADALLKKQVRQEIPINLLNTSMAKLITLGWAQEKKQRPTIEEMAAGLEDAVEELCDLEKTKKPGKFTP